MTGLPADVIAVPSHTGPGFRLWRGIQALGGLGPSVVIPNMWAAWAGDPTPSEPGGLPIRIFLTRDQAVRWILLRSRPVVYRVKVHPVDERGNRAHVYCEPTGSIQTDDLGCSGVGFSHHFYAVTMAHAWARAHLEKTA